MHEHAQRDTFETTSGVRTSTNEGEAGAATGRGFGCSD